MLKVTLNIVDIQCLVENSWILILCRGNFGVCWSMDTKKIGAFLKQCRKEKNLTQEQLAEKFRVSARTVSRWETGVSHS